VTVSAALFVIPSEAKDLHLAPCETSRCFALLSMTWPCAESVIHSQRQVASWRERIGVNVKGSQVVTEGKRPDDALRFCHGGSSTRVIAT